MRLPSLHSARDIRCAGLLLVTLMTMIGLGPAANAADPKDAGSTVAAPTGSGKISKEVATKNALAALPGTVTDTTVERKRGKNVWVIEIVAEKDGAETDVLVDMDSGRVIGLEH